MRRWLFILLIVTLAYPSMIRAQGRTPDEAPPVAPLFFQRARNAVENERYDQAVVDLSLFILFNPRDGRAYYIRGLSYQQLGQLDLAIDDLTRALEYSQHLPELQASIYATRAEYYATTGQVQRAIEDLDALIAIAPTPEAYANRALLHFSQAAFADAVSDLDEAISRQDENHPALFYFRARAKSELFDDEVAASDYLQWIIGIGQRTAEQQQLRPGDSITLDFAPSLVHSIPFSASVEDTINIVADNVAGDADPLLVIVDADGLALIGNDETARSGTSAVISGFHVPRDGDFNLLVTHSISGFNGQVIVRWQD
ncbi:MAG: tetratricopeptide repeat protein [Chloroflexota bacterium]|nr:MAG: hypothetical protein DIU68_04845 [Chloroflexota bacterium]